MSNVKKRLGKSEEWEVKIKRLIRFVSRHVDAI